MRRTLSHLPRRPLAGRSARILRSAVTVSALFATLTACNEVANDPTGPRTDSPETMGSEASFSWPEDPSHPVLEIVFESPDASGEIRIELMPELAPVTVAAVIELANKGYYDGTTFHRVIPQFMIQGGDPNSRDRDPSNDGYGDSSISYPDEFGQASFERGVVGMGNTGRANSSSAQFFIMHATEKSLDGRYTAIGRVIRGMEFVDSITQVEIDEVGRWGPKDRPITSVVMKKVHTIGAVATVLDALDRESALAQSNADENEGTQAPPASVATSPAPPAAKYASDDWERLEARGR